MKYNVLINELNKLIRSVHIKIARVHTTYTNWKDAKNKDDFCLHMLELFIPRFLGFSYFSQNKQIWAAEIDQPNFEGGLSFNRSLVNRIRDINIQINSTWRQKSMFHVLYGIFSVDKALLVDT